MKQEEGLSEPTFDPIQFGKVLPLFPDNGSEYIVMTLNKGKGYDRYKY